MKNSGKDLQKREILEELLKRKARKNRNTFCETVLRDSNGKRIKQSHIHRLCQDHIEWCRQNGKFCGLVIPWGHGKTEGAVIAGTLFEIGNDPNKRIIIVCDSDVNARQRVASIRRYIEKSQDYQKLYPEIKPQTREGTKTYEKWSDHELLIKRTGMGKDNSIEAWGLFSSGMGKRADVLIIDDPANFKNSVAQPETRPKVIEAIKSGWMSRLEPEPNGFMIYIATVWHEEDATADLVKNNGFCFLWMSVSQELDCIETRIINGDDSHPVYNITGIDNSKAEKLSSGEIFIRIPLWTEKWNQEALKKRLVKIGEKHFNRGYRQIPFNESDRTFPNIKKCIYDHEIEIQAEWPFFTGVDLSGDTRKGNVIFTLAKSPDGKKYPVDVRMGNWSPSQTIEEIYGVYDTYRPKVIMVESNAYQGSLIDWQRKHGKYKLPIQSYITGKNKMHPTLGIPSLDIEFQNEMWVIEKPAHSFDCKCGFCQWISSMKLHPYCSETDTIMASWFACESANRYNGKAKIISYRGK